jgi:hypothetical protein
MSSIALAQTSWEFAQFSINLTNVEQNFSSTFGFIGNDTYVYASSWGEFSNQFGTQVGGSWDVIKIMGERGFELVNYNSDTYLNADNVEISKEHWYFKRPLGD